MESYPAEKHGFILSGGGAFAAYEVGVVRALLHGETPATRFRPIEPEIVAGTSAGAFNAAVLASRFDQYKELAADYLQHVWLEEVAGKGSNGIFRWRIDPMSFLDPGQLLANPLGFVVQRLEDAAFLTRDLLDRAALFAASSEPVVQRLLGLLDLSALISIASFPQLIRRTVDFAAVRSSRLEVRITATNWASGELETFANHDLTDANGALVIMGSTALPGIFPPASIPPDVFVDGGVLLNTPLAPATRAGATELHIVYLDPDVETIPIEEVRTALGSLQRTMTINAAQTINQDIQNAAAINWALALAHGGRLRRVEGGQRGVGGGGGGGGAAPGGTGGTGMQGPGGAAAADPAAIGASWGDMAPVVEQLVRGMAAKKTYRPLTVHRYHPHDYLLGGALGILGFERDHVRRLIERGHHDALHHNCVVEGCLLPFGGPDA